MSAQPDRDRPTALTILIADREILTRAGVRRVLEAAGFEIVAETGDADGAIAAAERHRPQLCLLAVNMPGNGIVAAEMIRRSVPTAKIVMLTSSLRDEDLFAALTAGADGFLPKTMAADRLASALQGVLDGEAALPRVMTARLIEEFRERKSKRRLQLHVDGRVVEVTAREFEIVERLRRGDSTRVIADYFQIAEVTVRRHISTVINKLGVPDRRSVIRLLDEADRAVPAGPWPAGDAAVA
ncbi:MAG: response regulator transcription factor [Solirubrobacteraceae bacterium]